ncbi:MAG: hypothetical protein AAGI07_04220 [Bacteroidota bacterium]
MVTIPTAIESGEITMWLPKRCKSNLAVLEGNAKRDYMRDIVESPTINKMVINVKGTELIFRECPIRGLLDEHIERLLNSATIK